MSFKEETSVLRLDGATVITIGTVWDGEGTMESFVNFGSEAEPDLVSFVGEEEIAHLQEFLERRVWEVLA